MSNFVQNTVKNQPVVGIPGMKGDGWDGDIDSKIVAGDETLTPGRAVSLGSEPETIVEFDTAAYGILMNVTELEGSDYVDGYTAAPIMRKGRVFVDFNDPQNAVVGAVPEALADGQLASTGGTALTGSVISKVVDGVVEVDINLP